MYRRSRYITDHIAYNDWALNNELERICHETALRFRTVPVGNEEYHEEQSV
jgi:hypothetical protein